MPGFLRISGLPPDTQLPFLINKIKKESMPNPVGRKLTRKAARRRMMEIMMGNMTVMARRTQRRL
jgi:hypothetical protein